jgi:hypothetical protein
MQAFAMQLIECLEMVWKKGKVNVKVNEVSQHISKHFLKRPLMPSFFRENQSHAEKPFLDSQSEIKRGHKAPKPKAQRSTK